VTVRLVSFGCPRQPRVGALVDGRVIDLEAALRAAGAPSRAVAGDMSAFLSEGAEAFDEARRAIRLAAEMEGDERDPGVSRALGDVNLLPVVPRPPKIICAARNYAAHAAEGGADVPSHPDLFARFAQTLVAHRAPIVLPAVSAMVDWEAELAVIIGQRAHRVPAAEALDIVAGYAPFNDVSMRDYQRRTPQWLAGKNFDSSGPFGPALVTRDEVADPHALRLELHVNGELMQSASTADMVFSIPELISDISSWITLEPGDVIATGTPAGVGVLRSPPRFLKAGDVVRVTVEGVGVLENPVIEERT
jgi:2-keto-4-pentenoate hydratase/2-oxohepta-3-ene-1,7-dioic acid hydratase in catechol pathway